MPNSKFFIGSYAGDLSNRNANYASCDWASAVSTSYQSQMPASAANTCGVYNEPTNPYTYAPQPMATSSNYYAPQPITTTYDCSTQTPIVDYPVQPEYPSCPEVPAAPSCHCTCNFLPEEPIAPECPAYPSCPEEPVVPEEPSYDYQPELLEPPSCGCQPDVPTVPECPPEPEYPMYDPCQCVIEEPSCATAATEPIMTQAALSYANRQPRRRNRITSAMNRAQCAVTDAVNEMQTTIVPLPKRKHCGCNCLPETTPIHCSDVQDECNHTHGRYIDTPDDCDCNTHKREKCFLYEKLKHYHRKGKTICDFLNDYDEETFYALISD